MFFCSFLHAWFYAQTTLMFTAVDAFSLNIDIWNSDANSVQGSLRASDSVNGTTHNRGRSF